MEQQEETKREVREIVAVYRQPGPVMRERVFFYRRPLPECLRPQKKTALPTLLPAPPSPPPESPGAMRRRRRRGLRRFLACFGLLAVLAGLSLVLEGEPELPRLPLPFHRDGEDPARNREITIPAAPAQLSAALTVRGGYEGGRLSAQEIYRQVNPSVVLVMAQLDEGASVGTGVIFTSDGCIVTNYHVLEGGRDCQVILDTGESYPAAYVGGDADSDLAVLKMEGQDLPAAQFGDSDSLRVGDQVYAIGNPLGVELRGTMTDGIVSAIERDVWVDNRTMTLIQTNAALNSGNSGGPLINAFGQVVGINVIKMSSDHSTVEGLGFAIPSATIDRIINDLLTWGEVRPEPLLGVTVLQKAAELEHGLRGLEVRAVSQDSAADRAGIREGDFLLTAAGEPLETSQDLLRVRRHCYVGDRLEITLWRDGEVLTVTMELEDADG